GFGNAGLTDRGEDPKDDAINRLIQIRIVENDVRRFAAQLKCDMFNSTRRLLVDGLTSLITTCKRNLRHITMLDERTTRFAAESRDDVDHARRESRFFEECPEGQCGN